MERRLAAIFMADVVGFSRLMDKDETGTLIAVKELWEEQLGPKVAEHHGRIVKLMGDGALVEFPSVVDAVVCAVAVQRDSADRNAGVLADRRIEMRIGVNLGDVIIEGDGICGDVVNIASRIEQLAQPGGVALSASAYEKAAEKVGVDFEKGGEHELKNIAKPVRIYLWSEERRFAAILIADVVDFSRLMREDEAGTLIAVKGLWKELFEPRVTEHRGRIVKLMDDRALVEFPSVVAAVECAVAAQRDSVERNAGVPAERRIETRIGVNLGDVIVEGDDIHGDGVNVTASFEGLCGPGEVYVSVAVHD